MSKIKDSLPLAFALFNSLTIEPLRNYIFLIKKQDFFANNRIFYTFAVRKRNYKE